jgi:hypothetical protein
MAVPLALYAVLENLSSFALLTCSDVNAFECDRCCKSCGCRHDAVVASSDLESVRPLKANNPAFQSRALTSALCNPPQRKALGTQQNVNLCAPDLERNYSSGLLQMTLVNGCMPLLIEDDSLC